MRNIVRVVVIGIVGFVIGAILVLFVAGAFYHMLPAAAVFLLRAIPVFIWSLTDLWWALCVFLSMLVVWAMAEEDLTSPFTGPVLRGRSPITRNTLWPGRTKSPRPTRNGPTRTTPQVSGPSRSARPTSANRTSGARGGTPVSGTGTNTSRPRNPQSPARPHGGTRPVSGGPIPPRVGKPRHRRI